MGQSPAPQPASGGHSNESGGALPQPGARQGLEAQVVQGDAKSRQLCLQRLQHVIVCLQEKLHEISPKPSSGPASSAPGQGLPTAPWAGGGTPTCPPWQGDRGNCSLAWGTQRVPFPLLRAGPRAAAGPASTPTAPSPSPSPGGRRAAPALSLTLQTRASWSCRSWMVAFLELSTSCKGRRRVRQRLPRAAGRSGVAERTEELLRSGQAGTGAWLKQSGSRHGLAGGHPPAPLEPALPGTASPRQRRGTTLGPTTLSSLAPL